MEAFIEIPNLPKARVSLALLDGRIDKDVEENLRARNINIIKTEKITGLYEEISYHPDIMVNHLGGSSIIIAPNVENRMVYELERNKFQIIYGKKEVGGKYPFDVPYNAARIGDFLVCNVKYTDEVLLEYAEKLGLKIIDVKQGYSKCSICIVDSNSIITSDKGIFNKLMGWGIDCCLINAGGIELFNMNYGFIGGAGGCISDMELCFFGDLFLHQNFEIINEFILKHDKKVINLSKNKVRDFGTLIPLKEYSILTK